MLEPENQYSAQNPGGFYEPDQLTNFSPANRRDLSTAGGWALFLAILSAMSMLISLFSLSILPQMNSDEATVTLAVTLIGLGINGVVVYWYIVFYNNAKAIGRGSNDQVHAQKLSSSVLATFRLFGILMVIVLLFYLFGLAFAATGLMRIF